MTTIAVTSPSFSQHPMLRAELLSRYPQAKINISATRFNEQELVAFLKDTEKAIIGRETINETILAQLPKLKHISKYGVGIDNLDFKAMQKYDVTLAWTGGLNKRPVAELALHMIIGLLRKTPELNRQLQRGIWKVTPGIGLSEITLGIVGYGHVGQELARLIHPFGTKILTHDIMDRGVKNFELDYLFKNSDVISIHVPKTKLTEHFLTRERLLMMKKGSYLINTARGGLVDEKTLFDLLKSGHLGGAAMDTYDSEPCANSPLFQLDNFLATPHIGGSSNEAQVAMGMGAILGLEWQKEAKWENFLDYPYT